MTSGLADFAVPAPAREEGVAPASSSEWGARLLEFMLVGGATFVLLPLSIALRNVFGLDASEYAVGFATFYAAYVINDPHFAVTYLLFYKDVRERTLGKSYQLSYRLRYGLAAFVVPAALVVCATAAIVARSAETLGLLVELMFFLVGWHYVKQGFGVLSVLSARRGIRILPRERAVILLHCFAGWTYAWASPSAPAGAFEEKGVVYHAISHPRWVEITTGAALAASTALLALVLVAKWRREERRLPWAPLAGLLVTVWSWTIYSSADRLLQYVIPALHSVQYLYFVWLMKRNEARAAEGPPSFGRPTAVRLGFLAVSALGLGWLLFRGAPTFLDGLFAPRTPRGSLPDAIGATPFFAAFFVVVNIHHYFMDHVIWRRDNPDTRYLREPPQTPESVAIRG
jgi:hypothetical protein